VFFLAYGNLSGEKAAHKILVKSIEGSISPTLYVHLFRAQIPKEQKRLLI